jgi:hypothetical protein
MIKDLAPAQNAASWGCFGKILIKRRETVYVINGTNTKRK